MREEVRALFSSSPLSPSDYTEFRIGKGQGLRKMQSEPGRAWQGWEMERAGGVRGWSSNCRQGQEGQAEREGKT